MSTEHPSPHVPSELNYSFRHYNEAQFIVHPVHAIDADTALSFRPNLPQRYTVFCPGNKHGDDPLS